ncbi:hypothetical protein WJX75_009622 [Coccomyxa subellipsoidea]|uniref:Uncharacterized protein n=1 Tax=Coccomyxa subellipsoidea TaxID=248742 RepID=A0ABR2YB85_9CHLO
MTPILQQIIRCTGLQTRNHFLTVLQPYLGQDALSRSFFSSSPVGQSSSGTQHKTPEARVAFKSPSGVSRTEKSAILAKDLGVEVKEMNSGVEGQKLLNFKGMGQGPAGQTKAAVESNTRDVFKASHEWQNELKQDAQKMDATAHSAQNKYADSFHSAAAAAAFPQKPQARGERLCEDRFRDTGSMIEKAAKQPAQPCRREEEEYSVSRYQAMKAAATAALKRTSGIYTSNQESANQYVESAFQKGRDALDQGLQAIKDMANTAKASDDYSGPNSKEFPHTVRADNNEVAGRPMRPNSCSSPDAEEESVT